jgi:hypothetical protein
MLYWENLALPLGAKYYHLLQDHCHLGCDTDSNYINLIQDPGINAFAYLKSMDYHWMIQSYKSHLPLMFSGYQRADPSLLALARSPLEFTISRPPHSPSLLAVRTPQTTSPLL